MALGFTLTTILHYFCFICNTLPIIRADNQELAVYEIECKCNEVHMGQIGKSIIYCYLEHMKAFLKPTICKDNLASHIINTKHHFSDTENKLQKQY